MSDSEEIKEQAPVYCGDIVFQKSVNVCMVPHSERADLFRVSPFMDTTASEVGARIQNGVTE